MHSQFESHENIRQKRKHCYQWSRLCGYFLSSPSGDACPGSRERHEVGNSRIENKTAGRPHGRLKNAFRHPAASGAPVISSLARLTQTRRKALYTIRYTMYSHSPSMEPSPCEIWMDYYGFKPSVSVLFGHYSLPRRRILIKLGRTKFEKTT